MVQMKAAASLLIAAAAVAPALAQGYYEDSDLVSREDLQDLADILARDYGYGYDIEAREFDDMNDLELRELYERSPFLGVNHIKKWLGGRKKSQGGQVPHRQEGQFNHEHHHHEGALGGHHSFEHEHEHGFEHHGGAGFEHHHAGFAGASPEFAAAPPAEAPQQYSRSFEDMDELYERSPFLGVNHIKKWLGGRKKSQGGQFDHEHHHHEGALGGHHSFEHQHQHQHGFEHHGAGFEHHQHNFGGASPEADAAPPADAPLQRRSYDDMEEFEARDVEAEYDELLARYFDDLYERELAAEDEYTDITARSFDEDEFAELAARSPEPNFIEWIKNLFHPHHKDDKKGKKDDKKDAKKDDKKDAKKDDKKDDKDTKDSKTTTDPKTEKDDASTVDAREFDDFWYDLD